MNINEEKINQTAIKQKKPPLPGVRLSRNYNEKINMTDPRRVPTNSSKEFMAARNSRRSTESKRSN